MKYTVEIAGTTIDVEVDGGRVLVGGRAHDVRLAGRPGEPHRRGILGAGRGNKQAQKDQREQGDTLFHADRSAHRGETEPKRYV